MTTDEHNCRRAGPWRALLLLLVGVSAGAAEPRHTLKIVASSSIPPYVIAGEDRGIVVDVLRKALGSGGYVVTMQYAPNRRAKGEFLSHRADAMYNLACQSDEKDAYFSAPVIDYQNIVVTLDPPRVPVEGLDDLAKIRLVAFQNAPEYLGAAFAAMAKANPHYEEVSDQTFQVDMLFSSHADAIVLDRRIFRYYLLHPSKGAPVRTPYRIVPLFPQQARCVAFHDGKARDAFNAGLEALRKDGSYQAIVDAYDKSP